MVSDREHLCSLEHVNIVWILCLIGLSYNYAVYFVCTVFFSPLAHHHCVMALCWCDIVYFSFAFVLSNDTRIHKFRVCAWLSWEYSCYPFTVCRTGVWLCVVLVLGYTFIMHVHVVLYINGLVQDCCNSIALAMELLQSCVKPSIFTFP